jgi:hypothetical protein
VSDLHASRKASSFTESVIRDIESLRTEGVTPTLLQAALDVKRLAGQINVIVHAVGILVSLPYPPDSTLCLDLERLSARPCARQPTRPTAHRVPEPGAPDWGVTGSNSGPDGKVEAKPC